LVIPIGDTVAMQPASAVRRRLWGRGEPAVSPPDLGQVTSHRGWAVVVVLDEDGHVVGACRW